MKGSRVTTVLACLATLIPAGHLQAQDDAPLQDPSLDNLQHPDEYSVAPLGELGHVRRVGDGPRPMLLIAGTGFGGEIFDDFMASRTDEFTMFAITLPGFAGTPAPPMPAPGTSYGERSWTNGAIEAIEQLIDGEGLERPVLVGHWGMASEIVVGVARRDPSKVGAIVLISPIAKMMPPEGPDSDPRPLEEQIAYLDQLMAPRWFKTVTRHTWDINNWNAGVYSSDPAQAERLWETAVRATLPTQIRYLLERYSGDLSEDVADLEVPTLLIQPGYDSAVSEQPWGPFLKSFTVDLWGDIDSRNEQVRTVTIPDSRVFIMIDQPDRLNTVVDGFLGGRGRG